MSSRLFSPLTLRSLTFKNRIFVSPMCQYSCIDGLATDWHLVHLGSRAVGGAALVIAEATGVSPAGRISPGDAGIWNEEQIAAFSRVTKFIADQGSIPGIQIAHAGRKASTGVPWQHSGPVAVKDGGWEVLGPSPLPFDQGWLTPREMTAKDIQAVVQEFAQAATNSLKAGFQVVEIHMAHGYLLHEFLSPLSNHRQDEYGGSLDNRMRFPLQVVQAVRKVVPNHLPLFVRVSATDWVEGGWDEHQTVSLVKKMKDLGVDFIDCSTGGGVPHAKIPVGPGYQVRFAEQIRREATIPTGAVGMITEAHQAEFILQNHQADAVLLARELLRDPYWPLHAAKQLGDNIEWSKQYSRAKG